MRSPQFKKSFLARFGLPLLACLAVATHVQAQTVVSLTAAPTSTTLPDGSVVPMWGYTCGTGTAAATGGTCAPLNPVAAATSTPWSPVIITVPAASSGATSLTINLTNNLGFAPTGATASNYVPTSLVILGQLGGGLGNPPVTTSSPDHSQARANVTWSTVAAGATPGTPQAAPAQGPRVQSFATEVAAAGATLVTGETASPAALTWSNLKPGTYLIESGTHPSIQVPMGLYGIVVVTTPANGTTPGTAYPAIGTDIPAVTYGAEIPLLMSEIDPVQNNAVSTAVNTAGFAETKVWSGQPGGCGNPASPVGTVNTCYPPAVNYTPLYYLFNGAAFDKTHAATSLFQTTPAAPAAGSTLLVRFANAGLRMHVPSVVGATAGIVLPTNTAGGPGLGLIAEDGNRLPGVTRVQSEVFLAAGKTYDVAITVPPLGIPALPVYDRELSLSANSSARDAGMLAYISVNQGSTTSGGATGGPGGALPSSAALTAASAVNDTYNTIVPGKTYAVTDPSKGVIANDVNVYGVTVLAAPTQGTLTLNRDGTFTYVPNAGWSGTDTFTYCANGSVSAGACSSNVSATVTLAAAPIETAGAIVMSPITFTANVATSIKINPPGVLAADSDTAGYPLTVSGATASAPLSATLTGPGTGTALVDQSGGLTATVSAPGTYTFTYSAQNSQGTTSSSTATVTLVFPAGSGLKVTVVDGMDGTAITDYRWIIEEDRTFYIDPGCSVNPPPASCPHFGPVSSTGTYQVPTFGTNFHTSYMPVVATGCIGPTGAVKACESGQTVLGQAAVCDVGNGVCRTNATQQTPVDPATVKLDPSKRYYISVLPGDAANPFIAGNQTGACTNGAGTNASCGHGMGGAPIPAACGTTSTPVCNTAGTYPAGPPTVKILTQPSPYPPSKLSVFVYEDDFPLNGENDSGGGVDVLSPVEPGLGGFNITIMDDAGGTGDATGQVDYDMFNQPLSNSLAGTIDPATGLDACPISNQVTSGTAGVTTTSTTKTAGTGTIVTCPKYEADGKTLSPLAGQAVISNMMPGRYGVVATPAADRIARGEEWLQTNTLDGQKAHDSFLRIGEPSFFQEYGPAGFHVAIGFANPAIINNRLKYLCNGTDPNAPNPGQTLSCTNTLTGRVTTERMSRTPDERLYSSGSRDSFLFTQCYVSVGDPDGEDFAFTKCNADGTFTLTGLPDGDWRITTFDQWNDQLVDGLSTPVRLGSTTGFCPGSGSNQHTCNMGDIAANQWQANIVTRSFIDANGDGVSQSNEPGLALVKTNIRYVDGSFSNRNNTDLNGNAAFNEEFPLFNWYVVETDVTRYKNTGTHVVYDAGGPADGTPCGSGIGAAPCGNSVIGKYLANTMEQVSVPTLLRVPGAVYCADADCVGKSIANGPGASDPPSNCTIDPTTGAINCTTLLSTGRIDPPWVLTEGWQGFSGQNNFLEFGKAPYNVGENGGIRGHVVYSSTRPFDDPQFNTQNVWEPLVPNVRVNLYQETTAPDGSTALKLIDWTYTSSFDGWAQGFRTDGNPNMNCPGQYPGPTSGAGGDLFFFSLYNQPMYLDWYNAQHGGPPPHVLPNNAQFKCYDGMHNWNQVQPAPYDGMYQFPSVTSMDPVSGKPTGTNCIACAANPSSATKGNPTYDPYRAGIPMLPAGKYVVEMVIPAGYELVKEEDKNILIGDNFIAPVALQFPGLGSNVFIIPDQAAVGSYNANNAQNPTNSLGRVQSLVSHEGDTPTIDTFWPCVGALRTVPDYISLFPQSKQVSPFAGASRHLCDRKEVTLDDQSSSQAEFFIFTSTHAAAHFTGLITDDFTSEFDPFSPSFGEKFAPPDMPVAIKDWRGNEISRVYSDHWGAYNGLTYSTWEVNPPNPTGYSPTMMVVCMNDPGTAASPDPLFNPVYSNFCYEIPFMPGATSYLDTPVVPTTAFAGAGYNNVDCAYPDTTPAVSEVDGDAPSGGTNNAGPWLSGTGSGHTLKIYALGLATVINNAYSGPSAAAAPYNAKTVQRRYSFGLRPSTCPTTGNCPNVTVGGVPLSNVTSWTDTFITGTVQSTATVSGSSVSIPNCAVQQQQQYSKTTSTAKCGQLVITSANGRTSIDAVTVTIGGKAPTHVAATASIQAAIDAASPGDLLMIDPATRATSTAAAGAAVHQEMVLMWKPVRLQGVGAVSSVINANTQPAGKLDPWRRQVNCLFGLALNGQPPSATNPFDPNGTYTCASGNGGANFNGAPTTLAFFKPSVSNPQVDRLPLEAVIGWDASQNGNLAELLQEPSLMGALEGAAVTVLAKGMLFPAGTDPFGLGATAAGAFPAGTVLLNASTSSLATAPNGCGPNGATSVNPFPSNFYCNPSSIDALTLTNSSQGGGGIFVHGWGHNIQIANNRVQNNAGTFSGGINIGQGEFPPNYTVGGTNADPGSCNIGISNPNGLPTGTQLPYCFDVNVNMHNNSVAMNSSTGDELFSATPAGAGGVSIANGSDFYRFTNNWVCGNLSTGDGGGIAHIGFSYDGDIEHNSIVFNQSTNPTISTNGGGLLIMGAPDADPTCGATTDLDCVPNPPLAPADGVGPGLVINANLIMGNSAESGSGGGLRLQNLNGSDVTTFPTAPSRKVGTQIVDNWYRVKVTNNIIVNNVAGWDGAGISLQDALVVDIVNNTIASNDTTASSGVLFNTLGAPLASAAGTNCTINNATASCPQPAGVVAIQNSANLQTAINGLPALTCPPNHPNCGRLSFPYLANNAIWDNRTFHIGVGGLGSGTINQQNVVSIYNSFSNSVPQPQTATGFCPGGSSYWDIGIRGDTSPADHSNGGTAQAIALAPTYSILTDAADYPNAHNIGTSPAFLAQYCNGSRIPPEFGGSGYQVPPGISDATVPNPLFNLTPAATVDEGNNWVNMSWGPLSMSNPAIVASAGTNPTPLGNYSISTSSPAIDQGLGVPEGAPSTDFFNNPRPRGAGVDIGAVELQSESNAAGLGLTGSADFGGPWVIGTTIPTRTLTLSNTGTATATGIAFAVAAPFARSGGTCTATLTVGSSCTIVLSFAPTATGSFSQPVTVTSTNVATANILGLPLNATGSATTTRTTVSVTPSPLAISATCALPPNGLNVCLGLNTGVVTFTNTGAAGSAMAYVNGVTVASPGGGLLTWAFSVLGGDTCTGNALAPGQSCTVTVTFDQVSGARGVTHNGTITFTDTGAGSPQVGALTGVAN